MRLTADARGFVGLFGQTVLALRAQHVRAADPLPLFEQSLLGGDYTLRGFKLGYRTGDRLLAGSAEFRVPLSTPRHVTPAWAWPSSPTPAPSTPPTSARVASWDTGVGAGVFLQGPLVGLRLDVARGLGSARGSTSRSGDVLTRSTLITPMSRPATSQVILLVVLTHVIPPATGHQSWRSS